MSVFYTFLSSLHNCLLKFILLIILLGGGAKVFRGGAENFRRGKTSPYLPQKSGLARNAAELTPVVDFTGLMQFCHGDNFVSYCSGTQTQTLVLKNNGGVMRRQDKHVKPPFRNSIKNANERKKRVKEWLKKNW